MYVCMRTWYLVQLQPWAQLGVVEGMHACGLDVVAQDFTR